MAIRVGNKIIYSDLTTITNNANSYYNSHCPSHYTSYTTSARYGCSNRGYDSYDSGYDGYNSNRSNRGVAYGC